MHNRMHDFAYFLGFTERNWNAQDFNFGLTETFRENDPVLGNVQSGVLVGQRDNANMITLPEGVSPITNMYMWQSIAGAFYAPCVDGDYDMGVIGHEYTHMIENRMIGKGQARSGHHAGAMGESTSDLTAMEYLNENGFVPTDDENQYAVGTYATGNKVRAIRNYGMNFPSFGAVPEPGKQLMVNALNFSDMGYDLTGPQVHADGEIWSKTNFAIRQALAAKYDQRFPADDADLQYACANGELPPQSCPGNRRWMQLVFDSYLLMPTNPSMLQARDAILAADLLRFGGANQKELWLEFARHGFGRNATSTNTTANTDTDPTPDFEPIGTTPATVTFTARKLNSNTPVVARIFVGHYEARSSPIADTDPATTGPNLDNVARFAPGTYEFVATAPGYGHVRFREQIREGKNVAITLRFADNWASANAGAEAMGDTSGADAMAQAAQLRNLIDDTENDDLDDRREHRPGRQPLRRRQEGHGRPCRHGGAENQPRPGERPPLEQRQPLHGGAPVRDLGVRRDRRRRLRQRRGLLACVLQPGGRLPGRPAAAGGTAHAAAVVRHPEHPGHAPALRGQDHAVHGRPGVPGRSGRRPGCQRRLRLERRWPAPRGASSARPRCRRSAPPPGPTSDHTPDAGGGLTAPSGVSGATTVAACRAPSSSTRWLRGSRRRRRWPSSGRWSPGATGSRRS